MDERDVKAAEEYLRNVRAGVMDASLPIVTRRSSNLGQGTRAIQHSHPERGWSAPAARE
jgi:hypothetical protein